MESQRNSFKNFTMNSLRNSTRNSTRNSSRTFSRNFSRNSLRNSLRSFRRSICRISESIPEGTSGIILKELLDKFLKELPEECMKKFLKEFPKELQEKLQKKFFGGNVEATPGWIPDVNSGGSSAKLSGETPVIISEGNPRGVLQGTFYRIPLGGTFQGTP